MWERGCIVRVGLLPLCNISQILAIIWDSYLPQSSPRYFHFTEERDPETRKDLLKVPTVSSRARTWTPYSCLLTPILKWLPLTFKKNGIPTPLKFMSWDPRSVAMEVLRVSVFSKPPASITHMGHLRYVSVEDWLHERGFGRSGNQAIAPSPADFVLESSRHQQISFTWEWCHPSRWLESSKQELNEEAQEDPGTRPVTPPRLPYSHHGSWIVADWEIYWGSGVWRVGKDWVRHS